MSDSPQLNASGPLGVILKLGGTAVDTSYEIVAVRIRNEVGRIPTCRVTLRDGSVSTLAYPATDDDKLAPGTAVEIQAFWGSSAAETLFSGLIMGLRSRVEAGTGPQLEIDARGNAIVMAQGRHSISFEQTSDSDVMNTLITSHGLSATTAGSSTPRDQILHDSTDWDFLRILAERNGLWVICDGTTVTTAAPAPSDAALLKVTIGTDVISFDAELTALNAFDTATVVAWDVEQQAVAQGASDPSGASGWGNLSADTLAQAVNSPAPVIASAVSLPQDILDGYAAQIKARADLGRMCGSCRFVGSALAKPNTTLDIVGAAGRFAGSALITGVAHDLSSEGWFTEVTLGRPAEAEIFAQPRTLPPGQGLLTPVHGLTVGTVTSVADDPNNSSKIQISLPVLGADPFVVWARLASPYAGNNTGIQFLPETGDEVVVGFFSDDPSSPVILGAMHSTKNARATAADAKNTQKLIQTSSNLKIGFDDDKKVLTLETPGGAMVELDDTGKSVTLKDQNGNSIALGSGGITLTSAKDITLSATGAVTIGAKMDTKITGMNVLAQADMGATIKGNATAELSASGQITVKGAMVMIN